MNLRNELNEKQYEAVTTDEQYCRVIAGAGSGKTRVLTYRIYYLIKHFEVDPWNILAITFTNKVANEMKQRVTSMIPEVEKDLTIKTFHSFAAMFLRKEIGVLDYPHSFVILDEEDQTKIVKDIAYEMGYKKSDKIVGQTLSYIGSCKLKELYPDDVKIDKPRFENERTCLEIYTRYEEEKDKIRALDFDDLLLKANYILENYPLIRDRWQNRIGHILIDEFQDTNDVEYKFIKLLLKADTSLYVVGDPDQTIYTWRGANQKIILELERIFPSMSTVILNRNYRSTQNILNSANKLIDFNKLRVKKDLYTENKIGEPISVRSAPSSKAEAQYVVREIEYLVNVKNYSYKDIAILYRSNYITLDFESALMNRNIPYEIYGGLKFYQRREIKDILAYFRLIINVKDDLSFERIVNVPRRGIGEGTIKLIKTEAALNNTSMYEYCRDVDPSTSEIPEKALNRVKTFIRVIDNSREKINDDDEVFSKILEDMIWDFGFMDYYMKEEDGEERIENIKALFADIRHYLKTNPESSFDEYLQNVSLLSAQDDVVEGDHISLMTVHTAKGLEFPVVFVVRFNNGVFPNQRAILDNGFLALEEERRLAYVAMTRAKERLYLTFANDYSYVLGGSLSPSQFLKESGNQANTSSQSTQSTNPFKKPVNLFDFDNKSANSNSNFDLNQPIKQDLSNKTNGLNDDDWSVGDICIHKKFGRGKVVSLEGDGIIQVDFDEVGIKSILGNHPSVSKGGYSA